MSTNSRDGFKFKASGPSRIVKEYVKRVASHDLEEYPEWDLEVIIAFMISVLKL